MHTTTVRWGCNNALRKVRLRLSVLAAFGVLLAPLTAYAGSVTLQWNPSTGQVAGYVVWYGTSPRPTEELSPAEGESEDMYSGFVDVGDHTTAEVNGLADGVVYYFSVEAYSYSATLGHLSELSDEISGSVNQPPTITNPGNRTVKPGAFSLPILASDPDGGPLTYSAAGLPSGLTMSGNVITGNAALGTSPITATATDERSASASVMFTLAVVTSPFEDEPLTPGVHVMRAVHIIELRTRIASLRAANGLGPTSWTDPTLGVGSTPVRAMHITEMRSALNAVYSKKGQPPPTYAEEIVAGSTVIKAAHIAELRDKVRAAE